MMRALKSLYNSLVTDAKNLAVPVEKNYVKKESHSVALLGMVAPGRNFVVSPFFGPKIGEDQKKKVIAVKVVGFWPRNM